MYVCVCVFVCVCLLMNLHNGGQHKLFRLLKQKNYTLPSALLRTNLHAAGDKGSQLGMAMHNACAISSFCSGVFKLSSSPSTRCSLALTHMGKQVCTVARLPIQICRKKM